MIRIRPLASGTSPWCALSLERSRHRRCPAWPQPGRDRRLGRNLTYHELTLKNIDLFAREVLPSLRDIWDDEGWENHWWPQTLRRHVVQPVTAAR